MNYINKIGIASGQTRQFFAFVKAWISRIWKKESGGVQRLLLHVNDTCSTNLSQLCVATVVMICKGNYDQHCQQYVHQESALFYEFLLLIQNYLTAIYTDILTNQMYIFDWIFRIKCDQFLQSGCNKFANLFRIECRPCVQCINKFCCINRLMNKNLKFKFRLLRKRMETFDGINLQLLRTRRQVFLCTTKPV